MDFRLYLQFHMFEAPGEVPCDTIEEACAFFKDYAGNRQRCEREGVRAVWVTYGNETVLGEPPQGWMPGIVNPIIAGAKLGVSPFC